MTRLRVYGTEVIVLKGYDYGEADRILTLYTPGSGKLRAIAKGVRRIKSRKAGHLDLFTRSQLQLARGRQLDVITQAETIEAFEPMRLDLERSSFAHYVAELVDSFGMEDLANYPLYASAVSALRRLATLPQLDLVLRSFEMQVLNFTGYRPQLHYCVNCETTIRPVVNHFSARLGGVLCPLCVSVDTASRPISVAALKMLRNLQSNEDALLLATGISLDARREVEQRLREYITFRLETNPKSMQFIDQLRIESSRL